MRAHEQSIYREFSCITNSTIFCKKATMLVSQYICLSYAAATKPINLGIGLSILYYDIKDAKKAHFIERGKIDIFIQYFQKQFDILLESDFKPSNKITRKDLAERLNQKALESFMEYVPTIIEPVYETTV